MVNVRQLTLRDKDHSQGSASLENMTRLEDYELDISGTRQWRVVRVREEIGHETSSQSGQRFLPIQTSCPPTGVFGDPEEVGDTVLNKDGEEVLGMLLG